MRTIVFQTQIPSGSTRRHETWHEMDTRLIHNYEQENKQKSFQETAFYFSTSSSSSVASKGDLAFETNLHCVRRSFISFLRVREWGAGGGGGGGGGGGRGRRRKGG